MKKICIPLHTPVLLYKMSGVHGGIYIGGYTFHGHVFVMGVTVVVEYTCQEHVSQGEHVHRDLEQYAVYS